MRFTCYSKQVKLSETWADLSRSKDDADFNIRIEYYYAGNTVRGQACAEVSNNAMNGI